MVPLPSIQPAQLYHHILAHSDVFGMQTLELRSARRRPESSITDICLHIDVSPQSLGPTTSPQLSKLLQDSHDSYSIHVVAMSGDTTPHRLKLVFYLLLVNHRNQFPRLTHDPSSPGNQVSTPAAVQHEVPANTEDPTHGSLSTSSETELHLTVRKRRLQLGLDPNQRPAASLLVTDEGLVKEHMRSLQGHFEGIVKNAMHHMRRDELWKRMLYGGHRTDPAKPATMQVRTVHTHTECV